MILGDLIELTSAITAGVKVETVMDQVVEAALNLTGAEEASIFMLDTFGQTLHRACSRHRGYIKAMPTGKQVVLYGADMMPNLKEPAAFVVSTGTTLNLDDIDKVIGYDFDRIREEDKLGGLTTRALIILPLTIQSNRTIGILQVINPGASQKAVAALSEQSLKELQSLAGLAALYMWNARLLEDNTRLKRQFDRHLAELPKQTHKAPPKKVAEPQRPKGLIGESPPIEHAIKLVGKAAWSTVPILVRGETGTGKEMMAAFVHMSSDRVNKPFVVQNCAALPEALLESELFGHVKGAFTGASTTKLGLAHEANGGTLFLDEIGDMPLALQAKVLRLLQEGEVRRVGSTKTEKVDVRIVGATNINLEEKIAAGEFRQDLFYRLNVFPINLPPLRERPSDIPLLIDFFLRAAAEKSGQQVPVLSSDALDALMCWGYPGNVRELKNILDRARLMAEDGYPIELSHLPPELAGAQHDAGNRMPALIPEGDLKTIVGQYEAMVIEAKMRETNWNKTNAARILNVSRRTIIDKLNRYNITRPDGLERS
ncbi:sigma-54-dependent Fis family transcriptional regulator [Roseibium sediminicola]|uniref:Sigma 54-interacting transcriptional regulator n=1 Tax=Roseibium sediminicola TaxID=2933272 RepID=A0ABT0GV05_9HYPH|nr:sigma 54-interacting transcriptional regulator [Roseibium sp. CAU 1639]MCK7613262.1 sigma 54-interacting transcriptional regulator [Roseibium sp. CAU 1639]